MKKISFLALVAGLLALTLLFGVQAAPARASKGPYKVLAPAGLLDTGLAGIVLLEDYGPYALYSVSDEALSRIPKSAWTQIHFVTTAAEVQALLEAYAASPPAPEKVRPSETSEGSIHPEAIWPGPDGFGYSGSTISYNWVEISGSGTSVALGDDECSLALPIGFTFSFYGANYTNFYICSNGYVMFGSALSDLSNDCPLPNASTPDNIIALMWDDLDPGDTGDLVYYESFSNCPIGSGRCLVVQYENYHHYSYAPPGPIAGTFEAVIFEGGNVIVQFQDAGAEEGLESTTGIEGNNAASDYGLTYACNTAASLSDNLALLFSREPDFTLSAAPASQEICTPNNALYNVTLGQINGFNQPVTLSASGHPPGTTATFVPNPVTPPGASTLTIGNTGAAAAGTYNITITGVGGGKNHSANVQLVVYTGVPAAPTLVSPPNNATEVALKPTLTWNASAQATGYYLEIATDPGFGSVVYSASEAGTSHNVTTQLDPTTTYYWHVRGNNLCGNGPYSGAWRFTTRAVPPILLVDDDDNAPDVRGDYTAALDAIGASYDIWDTGNSDTNEPDAATLALYQTVIWFSGDNSGQAGPGETAETNLGNWLNSGGRCFFISSEDYYYNRGLTSFMQTYLGVSSVGSDTGDYTRVTGQGSVFAGMGPYDLDYARLGLTDWSDRVEPNGTAEVAFVGDNSNNAAVDKDTGTYRTTFWGYPWEALRRAQDRRATMQKVVDWCAQPDFTLSATPSAQSVCVPNNAVYNVTVGEYRDFTDPVTFSASGHPPGTTATFVPNPVTPPGASTLTIGNTGAAAPGTYNITITGVGGAKTHTTGVQLVVNTAVPAAPTLLSPANGAICVLLQPTLTWNAASQAASYYIEIATDPAFSNIVYTATDPDTSHTVTSALNNSTTYYWHVRAANACGNGSFSTAFRFTTVGSGTDQTISNDNAGLDIFFNADAAAYNGAFQVQRNGSGQVFAPSDEPGDYGLFVSYNGCEIGPDVVGQTFDDDWDTCCETRVTGSGTSADPWIGVGRFTTDGCGSNNLTLAYTLTYVDGNDFYTTDWQICGGTPGTTLRTYFAGDLYRDGDDYGYGYYDASIYGVGTQKPAPPAPPDGYMILVPVSPAPATHYQEALYSAIWSTIAAGGSFADTIHTDYIDTGGGLQWDLTFDADGCASVSAYTTFSPVGIYVDDDYTPATPGWGITHFAKIQDGINAASAGQIVFVENVAAGPSETYVESVTLNKDIVVRVNGSMQLNGSLAISRGTWEAPLGTMGITGNFAHSGGAFNARTGTVRFNGGAVSTYSGGPTTFYNLIVEAGTILDVGTNNLFDVAGSVTNNGALRQTRFIGNGATVSFLNISTDKYYGVVIYAAQALRDTTVTVYGNQLCPNNPNGGLAVLRCYEIDPTRTDRSSDITFYYRDAEENGQTAPDAYHWNGTSWDLQTLGGRDNSGVENNWVRAIGVSQYSPFSLWGSVTAVELASFQAALAPGGILLSWETVSEYDNMGFYLYRSVTPEALGQQLNLTLIPSELPGEGMGASYEFLDRTAQAGITYYYTLEDVDYGGLRTPHGPVVFTLWRVYLPLVK